MRKRCIECGKVIGKEVVFGVKYRDGSMLCHSCMVASVMRLDKLGLLIVKHERPES